MEENNKWLKKDFKYTFFGSETLYYEHIETLFKGRWIVGNIINFYFLLLKEKYAKKLFSFIPPPLLMIVEFMSEEDIEQNLKPLRLPEKDLIFIPINDNRNISGGGGVHWSLLVYVTMQNRYFYFDSKRNMNLDVAQNYCKKFDKFINPKNKDGKVNFSIVDCQQQGNNYDCGIFLLSFCERFADGKSVTEGTDATAFREHVLKLIKKYSGSK